jgi:hypothetical protein
MQGGHKKYRSIIKQTKKYIYATKYITFFRLITSTRKSQSLPQYQRFSSIERLVEGGRGISKAKRPVSAAAKNQQPLPSSASSPRSGSEEKGKSGGREGRSSGGCA